jgi:hypothetical protein
MNNIRVEPFVFVLYNSWNRKFMQTLLHDMTPISELLLAENGAVPGDRPHCELILTFPKTVEIDLYSILLRFIGWRCKIGYLLTVLPL